MEIAVLGPSHHTTSYEWTRSAARNVEAVAHVAFDHPQAGPIEAYAKFYPANGRGLVNEITAWLLARAAGLPVPDQAFIALVELDKLPQPLEGFPLHAFTLGDRVLPAFCTRNAKPTGVQPIVNNEALLDELRRWKHMHACVAFDERAANTDRHLGNLVRTALREFVLIDHGRLAWSAATPEWSASTLDALASYPNRLASIVWGDPVDDRDSSATLAACTALAGPAASTQAELEHWWAHLVPDEDDRVAWKAFLASRLEHVEYLLRKRFALLT